MAVRKHEKGAIFEENQRISNVSRIAGVRKYGAIRTIHKYKSTKVRSNPNLTQVQEYESTEQSEPYTSTRV